MHSLILINFTHFTDEKKATLASQRVTCLKSLTKQIMSSPDSVPVMNTGKLK